MKKALLLLCYMTIIFLPISPAQSKVWQYTQITNTSGGNRVPSISDSDIVWSGYDAKGKYSVMHYNIDTGLTKSITSGITTGFYGMATVNDGLVAFRSYDKKETQNFHVYDLKNNMLQTIYSAPKGTFPPFWGYEPSYHSIDPMIHNGEVVFSAWDGNDYEVMSWKNGITRQITNNSIDDYEPQVWNGTISWSAWDQSKGKGAVDVYYYNGTQIKQVTSRRGKDEDTFIADGKIAFTGQSYEIGDGGFNIYSYDTATENTSLVLAKPFQDYEPVIYQNTFAWSDQRQEAGEYRYNTYYYDGYKLDSLRTTSNHLLSAIGPFMEKDKVVYSEQNDKGFQIVMASYKAGGVTSTPHLGAFLGGVSSGQFLFTAQGQAGIGVYDLSNPASPTRLSKINFQTSSIFDLALHNNYLYTASRTDYIDVIDISNKLAPKSIGKIQTGGISSALTLDKNTLYVGTREGGLSVVNLSQGNGHVVGHLDLPGSIYSVGVQNNIGYVAGYTAGLHLVDLSDKANPTHISTISNIGKVWDVAISKNTVFLSIAGYGLVSYDITTPNSPLKLSSLALPNGNMQESWEANFSLTIKDNIAFASAGTQGIFAIDISTPSALRILERYETPGFAWSTALYGNYLVGLDYTKGFNLYNISDHFPRTNTPATPIPASLLLLGTGLISLGCLKQQKRHNA